MTSAAHAPALIKTSAAIPSRSCKRRIMAMERRRGAALPVEAVSLLLHGGDGGKIKRM